MLDQSGQVSFNLTLGKFQDLLGWIKVAN